jgi:hypothetical protein
MKLPSTKLILLSVCAGILVLCSLPTENSVSTITAETQNNTTNATVPVQPENNTTLPNGLNPYVPSTARLRVQAIDGRTRQPLTGAEVVLIENEKRYVTGNDGYTPWFDAPIIRNPKYRPLVAELHGQLGVIVYKNGYRDSIHLGVRMHEGTRSETTVWMYRIEPGDRRIEPVLYQVPYHHLWLIELADRFRQKSQIGEGPERP